jgi:cell surface protein SprA
MVTINKLSGGTVQIYCPSLQASNTSFLFENNSIFGQRQRRFMGVNVEQITDNFMVGATYIKMSERPCPNQFGQRVG